MLLLKIFNILSTNGFTDIPDRICHLTCFKWWLLKYVQHITYVKKAEPFLLHIFFCSSSSNIDDYSTLPLNWIPDTNVKYVSIFQPIAFKHTECLSAHNCNWL